MKKEIDLVLLDLDGVIYNFVQAILDCTIFNTKELKESDITAFEGLSNILSLSDKEFWESIIQYSEKNNFKLFSDGELYEWTDNLITVIKKYTNNIIFCTDPGPYYKHWGEKQILWENKLKKFNIPLMCIREKHLLSKDSTVLIDDKNSNIDNFNKGEGIGILFPQYWNELNIETLLLDRAGYIDCTLEDIAAIGFKKWKELKKKS